MGNFRAAAGGIVLVTGASRGLGRVMALRLADAGFTVAVNYRASAAEADALVQQIQSGGGRAATFRADLASPAEARAVIDTVERSLGPLTAVVSNAGITRDRLLLRMSED